MYLKTVVRVHSMVQGLILVNFLLSLFAVLIYMYYIGWQQNSQCFRNNGESNRTFNIYSKL